MTESARPKIVSSKCLEFAACRWNGVKIPDEFVRKLIPYADFLPVCPEFEIGLGIPRDPIRTVLEKGKRKLVQPATGKDITEKMTRFSKSWLSSLDDEIDGFILKSRSPSCGIKDVKIYSGMEKAMAIEKGAGFFGSTVLERFPDIAIEDEGRLKNFKIREHFLTRIFALARWCTINKNRSMARLVEFHSSNKLLLMAQSQKTLRALGKIVANHDKKPLANVFNEYGVNFKKAFAAAARYGSNINVLMHAMGHFSEKLSPGEKRHFLATLTRYKTGKIPLSVPLGVLRSWIERFDNQYLASQTFFEPYPDELVEITDSGKGRDY